MIGNSRQLPLLPGCVQGAVSSCGAEPHMNPLSTMQVGEQPSPASLLPSSQSSPISMLPLPQVVEQACVTPAEVRQVGSFVQVLEQPVASPKNRPFGPLQPVGYGPSLFVPQSPPSFPSFMPLPQMAALHIPGAGPPGADFGQVEPGSTWQADEQPSLSAVLLSSHCSPPLIMPSPQAGTQGRPGTRHW